MPTIEDVAEFLGHLAPARLAAEWDNVGLLVGRRDRSVGSIMACLTVTPASAAEAIDQRASLIVTHHPFPFRPTKRITSDSVEGKVLLDLIAAGVAVYSAHTAFDSAAAGINQRLAEGIGLSAIAPLVADEQDSALGAGRRGDIKGIRVGELAHRCAAFLKIAGVQLVGEPDRVVRRVGIACGSGGELFDAARRAGCDCFLTGETRFHTCLESEASGIALILTGHYASERFAVEALAEVMHKQFPQITCWASRQERDPLFWLA